MCRLYADKVLDYLPDDLMLEASALLPHKIPADLSLPQIVLQELPPDHGSSGRWAPKLVSCQAGVFSIEMFLTLFRFISKVKKYVDHVLSGKSAIWKGIYAIKKEIQRLKSREYLKHCAAELFEKGCTSIARKINVTVFFCFFR